MNETISAVTFETVTAINTSPVGIASLFIIWAVPLFIYFLVGALAHGKSSSGKTTSKPMIFYPNFWYAVLIWGLGQAILILLWVFPIWLKIFT